MGLKKVALATTVDIYQDDVLLTAFIYGLDEEMREDLVNMTNQERISLLARHLLSQSYRSNNPLAEEHELSALQDEY